MCGPATPGDMGVRYTIDVSLITFRRFVTEAPCQCQLGTGSHSKPRTMLLFGKATDEKKSLVSKLLQLRHLAPSASAFSKGLTRAAQKLSSAQCQAVLDLATKSPAVLNALYGLALDAVKEGDGPEHLRVAALTDQQRQELAELWLHAAGQHYEALSYVAELEHSSAERVKLWRTTSAEQLSQDLVVLGAASEKVLLKKFGFRLAAFDAEVPRIFETNDAKEQQQQTKIEAQILEEEAKAKENAQDWNKITVKRIFKVSVDASPGAAHADIETPLPSASNRTSEQLAGIVLRRHRDRLKQLQVAERLGQDACDYIMNPELLNQQPDLILAHNISHEMVEIYQVRRTAELNAGALVKVGVARNVKHGMLPDYLETRRDKYWTTGTQMHVHADAPFCCSPSLNSTRSRRTRSARYLPFVLTESDAEKKVSIALSKVGRMGGEWNALLTGSVPFDDLRHSGFRTATVMFAVAGLCRWYHWQQPKGISWMVIPLHEDCQLLAMCHLGDELTPMGIGKPANWMSQCFRMSDTTDQRLDIYANRSSPYWQRRLMIG